MSSIPETPYFRCASFGSDQEAGKAYFICQELIAPHAVDCDLSVYRFIFAESFHVVVLGEPPVDELGDEIDGVLAAGTPVDLPDEMRNYLIERRAEVSGPDVPWMEGHYRPGQHVQVERSSPGTPLFSLGQVTMTTNLRGKMQEANPEGWFAEVDQLIRRHAAGDWGDLDAEDLEENRQSLARGFRLFSAYNTKEGIRVWVITEADRSGTTALLPEDY